MNYAEDICHSIFVAMMEKIVNEYPNQQIWGFDKRTGEEILFAVKAKDIPTLESFSSHIKVLLERIKL